MTQKISELSPNLKYFYEISAIPRGSFREKALVDHIQRFCEDRGFWYTRDSLDNLIAKVPASPGREGEPPLILQSHTDMVCNKVEGCDHDFETEGIDIQEEDGWLHGNGTTLGADDGAGVANMLALMDEKDLSHPPLECIFTVQEEDGMGGAKAIDLSCVEGRRMIGLDGIEEGTTIYSASAVRGVKYTADLAAGPCEEGQAFRLTVKGLTSGHGALFIGAERANAIKAVGQILRAVRRVSSVRLAEIQGGGLIHVIPESCQAIFVTEGSPEEAEAAVQKEAAYLKQKFQDSDPGMEIRLDRVSLPEKAGAAAATDRLIQLLYLLPVGAQKRQPDDLSLVAGSFNLSIIRTEGGQVKADLVCRSNYPVEIGELYDRALDYGALTGVEAEMSLDYAGYHVPTDAPLIQLWGQVCREETGRDLGLTYMHSALDAGEICQKLGIQDIIVIMPDTPDVHTPRERMNIQSYIRTYGYLKKILERA